MILSINTLEDYHILDEIIMLDRSVLTATIGFLCGCLFYYVGDANVLMILVMGCVGYFFGLILDNADIKRQLETFYFSNQSTTQDDFRSEDISEANIVYSSKENLTIAMINFQVDTKPQDFRLSVLKNLQEHQFRIEENSGKTILSLSLDYPECNYPQLLSSENQTKEFHFDIRERSLDFQNAVKKIIPGLVFAPLLCSGLQQEEEKPHDYHNALFDRAPQSPPSNRTFSSLSNLTKKDAAFMAPSPQKITEPEESQDMIDESKIMEDLLPSSPSEPQIPDLSPENIQQLRKHNERRLEAFLNERPLETSSSLVTADRLAGGYQEEPIKKITEAENMDSVKIDLTNLNHSTNTKLKQFDLDIIDRIDQRRKQVMNQRKTNLEIQKEIVEAKDDISEQLLK